MRPSTLKNTSQVGSSSEGHAVGDVDGNGYWYRDGESDPVAVDLLNLLRKYRESEKKMRGRTRDSMGMGETDLVALRYLIRAKTSGKILRQCDLAQMLEISGASASVLVDRLCKDGHVQRVPHPEDRRSVAVEPTAESDREVRETLSAMHNRMLSVVEELSAEELRAVAKFLSALIASVDHVDTQHVDTQEEAVSASAG